MMPIRDGGWHRSQRRLHHCHLLRIIDSTQAVSIAVPVLALENQISRISREVDRLERILETFTGQHHDTRIDPGGASLLDEPLDGVRTDLFVAKHPFSPGKCLYCGQHAIELLLFSRFTAVLDAVAVEATILLAQQLSFIKGTPESGTATVKDILADRLGRIVSQDPAHCIVRGMIE
jgi:hypothetical protein